MTQYHIRSATPEDVAAIKQFIVELAIYEKAEHEVLATEADLHDSLFGEKSNITGLMCECDDELVGFAVFFYNYSTWLGKRGVYLEDLYVTPKARGKGAGRHLLQYLAHHAVTEGCGRFEWSVLDWNQPAIDFYQQLGAKPMSEWIGYRLEGDALQALAERHESLS